MKKVLVKALMVLGIAAFGIFVGGVLTPTFAQFGGTANV
jgi:hypothetical protein